jgi:hypothetical protein
VRELVCVASSSVLAESKLTTAAGAVRFSAKHQDGASRVLAGFKHFNRL